MRYIKNEGGFAWDRSGEDDEMRTRRDEWIVSTAFIVSNELKGEHEDGESKERDDESV